MRFAMIRPREIVSSAAIVDGQAICAVRVAAEKDEGPHIMSPDPDTEPARAELYRLFMTAFCHVLRANRLPTMAVMSLAAGAVGSIYQEVANQHRCGDPCPCGWQPNPAADVEALQAALAAMTEAIPLPDLRVIQVAGRA